jgi:hypothetical protein
METKQNKHGTGNANGSWTWVERMMHASLVVETH